MTSIWKNTSIYHNSLELPMCIELYEINETYLLDEHDFLTNTTYKGKTAHLGSFFTFQMLKNGYHIIVIDDCFEGEFLNIIKKFEYHGRHPSNDNISSIIKYNDDAYIFKIWIDDEKNFNSELLHKPIN